MLAIMKIRGRIQNIVSGVVQFGVHIIGTQHGEKQSSEFFGGVCPIT